jgi:hypothetical protein
MGAHTFDVVLTGLGHGARETSSHVLARALGLPLVLAEQLAKTLPRVLSRDVTLERGQALARELAQAGLEVRLVPHDAGEDAGRATLPEVYEPPERHTLLEIAKKSAERAHVLTVLESGARVPSLTTSQPLAEPAVFPAPVVAAALEPRLAAAPAPLSPVRANVQDLVPSAAAPPQPLVSTDAARPWALTPSAQSLASGFAADFGKDVDLARALPRSAVALASGTGSASLARDPSPLQTHTRAQAPARESLRTSHDGLPTPRTAQPAPAAPELGVLQRTASMTPSARVEVESRTPSSAPAAMPRAPALLAPAAPSAARSEAPGSRSSASPPAGASAAGSTAHHASARPFRHARFGVSDDGGTGLPRRLVWLLGILWLSVGLLLWSRGVWF